MKGLKKKQAYTEEQKWVDLDEIMEWASDSGLCVLG